MKFAKKKTEGITDVDSNIDWAPSVEERGMNALFYENEGRASLFLLGSTLTLYEIWRSWRSCHACIPVLLELSTKSPLSAACRRRKEWQRKEKKRRGFGEPHWTAQADMLIAKLCKGDDCHNSAGGQNDPEPPLPFALHLSIVHSVQALISSTALQACNYMSWWCRTPVSFAAHVIVVVTCFWITPLVENL